MRAAAATLAAILALAISPPPVSAAMGEPPIGARISEPRARSEPTAAGSEEIVVPEIDEKVDHPEAVAGWVREAADAALSRRGLAATADADHPWQIRVHVSGSTLDWQVALELREGGSPIEDQPPAFACECTSDDLVTRLGNAIDDGIDRLSRGADQPATAPPSAGDEPTSDAGHPTDPVTDAPGRRPLGPMGKAGIGVMVAGTLVAVGGGVMVGIGTVGGASVETESARAVDLRPGGIALLAVGGAGLITGIVLLVVDRSRAQKRLSVSPMTLPSSAGLLVQGRF